MEWRTRNTRKQDVGSLGTVTAVVICESLANCLCGSTGETDGVGHRAQMSPCIGVQRHLVREGVNGGMAHRASE